jgi:cold shock CspA family protein
MRATLRPERDRSCRGLASGVCVNACMCGVKKWIVRPLHVLCERAWHPNACDFLCVCVDWVVCHSVSHTQLSHTLTHSPSHSHKLTHTPRGFGFLAPSDSAQEVFFHVSVISGVEGKGADATKAVKEGLKVGVCMYECVCVCVCEGGP